MAEVKRGYILMNLGSPDSTQVKDLRRYLNEFLMDERVIDMPYLSRLLLVKGIIVPFRRAEICGRLPVCLDERGLTANGDKQATATGCAGKCTRTRGPGHAVWQAHSWTAYDELLKKAPGLQEVVLVPLYPHYAMSSYETAVEYAKEIHAKKKYPFKLTIIPPFYNEPVYLHALAESIKPYLQQDYDQILFSYHGIPERHIRKSDITGTHCLKVNDCCNVASPAHSMCYRHQCFVTTRRTAEALGIPAHKVGHSFQSRLGRDQWLLPYTAERLAQLPGEGVKKILVVCPAFVSDCLETLEEMGEEGKEIFLHAGGESFTLIPCLNTHPLWVKAVVGWVKGEWGYFYPDS